MHGLTYFDSAIFRRCFYLSGENVHISHFVSLFVLRESEKISEKSWSIEKSPVGVLLQEK